MISKLFLAASASTLVASLAAQTAPCESRNDANTSVSGAITASPFVGLNPSSRAYQFSPSTVINPRSAAIFTGSPLRNDFMRLEIWDEDPVTMAPGNPLSVGTLFSPMSMTASWLGTNLDNPTLTLNPGTNYWFVWIESGASIVPEEPGGAPLTRRTRPSTNPWGTAGSGAGKFRIFCNLLDDAGVTNFGPACATSSGQLPAAFTNDAPTAGNAAFGVEGTNFPPSTSAWLLIGIDQNHVSSPLGPLFPAGCMLNTDILGDFMSTTGMAEIGDQPSSPRPSPFGHVRFPLDLTPVPMGAFFSVQIVALDSGSTATTPVVTSNAVRITTQ